jgi:hypothetical protein
LAARNAAEADLEQLEPFAVPVGARPNRTGAGGGEAGRVEEFRRLLAEQSAQNVEDAAQRMGAARQRGREFRLEQRAFGMRTSIRS